MKAKNTQTSDLSIQHYLRDIGQFPLLSREEETDLAYKIQKGDRRALETMINANLRLVVKVATDFNGLGIDLADLIAEGNIGLMTAAERFDPERGAKFSTYAVLWIKQKIRRALSNQARTIRLPIHVIAESSELQRAERSLSDQLEREATLEELALETGMPPAKITRLQSLPSASASLDATPYDDSDLTLAEVIADESAAGPDERLAQRWVEEQIESVMPALSDRERSIIERRFGLGGCEPALLAELGDDFGVTRERIRQVQNAGLAKLKVELINIDPYSFAAGESRTEALSA